MMRIELSLVHFRCLKRKLKKRKIKLDAETMLAMMFMLTDVKNRLKPAWNGVRLISLHLDTCKAAWQVY